MYFVKMATAVVASSGYFFGCCRYGYWSAEEKKKTEDVDKTLDTFHPSISLFADK